MTTCNINSFVTLWHFIIFKRHKFHCVCLHPSVCLSACLWWCLFWLEVEWKAEGRKSMVWACSQPRILAEPSRPLLPRPRSGLWGQSTCYICAGDRDSAGAQAQYQRWPLGVSGPHPSGFRIQISLGFCKLQFSETQFGICLLSWENHC